MEPTQDAADRQVIFDLYQQALAGARRGRFAPMTPSDWLYQQVLGCLISAKKGRITAPDEARRMLEADFEIAAASLLNEARNLALHHPSDLVSAHDGSRVAIHAVAITGILAAPERIAGKLFQVGATTVDVRPLREAIRHWAQARGICSWVDPSLYHAEEPSTGFPAIWRAYLQRVGLKMTAGTGDSVSLADYDGGGTGPFVHSSRGIIRGEEHTIVTWAILAHFAVPAEKSEDIDDALFDQGPQSPATEWADIAKATLHRLLPASHSGLIEAVAPSLAYPLDAYEAAYEVLKRNCGLHATQQ